MSNLILRQGVIAEDDWTLTVEAAGELPARAKIIVPLARWRTEREALLAGAAAVGVLLPNTEDVEALYPLIADRPLIALQFPTFTDGRALTQAVLLRTRLGYSGELRALGDVIRDLVFWLGRCGIDSIVPRPDQNLQSCQQALREIQVAYQGGADEQTPVWVRRRARARAAAQARP